MKRETALSECDDDQGWHRAAEASHVGSHLLFETCCTAKRHRHVVSTRIAPGSPAMHKANLSCFE